VERPEPPIVFAGPSLWGLPRVARQAIDLRPPAKRGDIEALLQQRPGVALLVDGLFGSQMAVTPTECRQVLEAGWKLCGAASIGALRSSELWSVGMVGIGDIYTLLRLGVVDADAEVAVAYHPDTFDELGASIVHVRSILQRSLRKGLDRDLAQKMLTTAREIYWAERSWSRLAATWRVAGIASQHSSAVIELGKDPAHHPKVRDAHHSVKSLLAELWIDALETDGLCTSDPVGWVDRSALNEKFGTTLEEAYGSSVTDCAR
jgi:TfuA protein